MQKLFSRDSEVKKIYKISITESAQNDIEEIWQYIALDNIETATKFIDRIEKAIFSLESFPERNPLIPEYEILNIDYRQLVYKKYRIIYRISENMIYVLRILHGYCLFVNTGEM
jgi:toxin ParE1/3/4